MSAKLREVLPVVARKWKWAAQLQSQVAKPTMSLNELRTHIWRSRAEFWFRKASTYDSVRAAAYDEAITLQHKLANFGALTGKEVAVGTSYAVQIFGAFCLGEIIGRDFEVGGYPGFYN